MIVEFLLSKQNLLKTRNNLSRSSTVRATTITSCVGGLAIVIASSSNSFSDSAGPDELSAFLNGLSLS